MDGDVGRRVFQVDPADGRIAVARPVEHVVIAVEGQPFHHALLLSQYLQPYQC